MSVEEFLREFHHSLMLGAHQNILTVFPDMVFSLEGQCCMFASEYAPLGKRQFQSYLTYIDVPDFFFRGGGQKDPLEFRNFFSGAGSKGSRG